VSRADRSQNPLRCYFKPGVLPDRLPSLAQSTAVRDARCGSLIESLVVKEVLRAGMSRTPHRALRRGTPTKPWGWSTWRRGGGVLLNPTRVDQVFAVADAAT